MASDNLNIYFTWKSITSEYNNNKFKISAPIWNDKFDLIDGSWVCHKKQTLTKNPPVLNFVNRIKNRIVFKIKRRYQLELLTSETMNLFRSTKDVDKEKDWENVPKLESVEVALVQCNLVKNDYKKNQKFHLLLFQINNFSS